MEMFTVTQKERISELGAGPEFTEMAFETVEERNQEFRKLEKQLVRQCKAELANLLNEKHVTRTVETGHILENWLQEEGFTKVVTPTIISREMLSKMTIDEFHHLSEQVFWLDGKKCLRPMLAPNLYVMMRELYRISKKPVKIYEIGSCFRKESQGAQHMNEFTMLNCVEMAYIEDGKQLQELERLAHKAMEVLGVSKEDYEIIVEESEVYGENSFDIIINGMEVASGSYGPHFLDPQWGVFETWVGIGFGIERLTMAINKGHTIKRYGKSISFIDGQPLNI